MTDINRLFHKAASLLFPELGNPEDPQSLDRNFSTHAKSTAHLLTEINEVILLNKDYIASRLNDKSTWSDIVPVLLLCGEHSLENPWTSKDSVEAAARLMWTLNSCLTKGKEQKFVIQTSAVLFDTLWPKLRKDNFAANPAAVAVFTWLLFQHKHPDLSDVLHLIIPTTLILVDDFRQENRITGLQCLQHIIQESDASELLRYGRAELFFDALKPLQYQQDPNLVEALYPALFACLKILYPHPEDSSTWLSISAWDESISILLNNLNLVQHDEQKLKYLDVLENLICHVKARFIRFLTPTLKIFDELLDVHAGTEELYLKSIQVLEKILHYCWPCVTNHPGIFWLLVKFTHDVIKTKPNLWERLHLPIKCCVTKFEKPAKMVVDIFRQDLTAHGDELGKSLYDALNSLMLN